MLLLPCIQIPTQALQQANHQPRAAGRLLCLSRQPLAAGDLSPRKGLTQDRDHVLPGLEACWV